ncbi:182 kDa tankyrase-1-binding protein [Dipodomys merriami]|uniref:182 kDa tankyrase-1-binding protein n=1 Tax=Dipodomys merriami TaxID=94247 RepID=UPI003855CE17
MKVSTLRESTVMASPPAREMEEELAPAGSEPGDPRAKPPVKPKPRALPTKPALPAKPSLLVPVGPRPPRGPLAELPSARKMNMLAGPQPYGGSKRPLPFAPRPMAEASAGGEVAQEASKEEGGKEEPPPLTPPARCAAPGGVRKAPAPFRPASERFAAATVEEILAKMEQQPHKEVPASPDRLWGSRLTFNHDGSSRYGPRTYGGASGPREEDDKTLSRGWSQEGPAKTATESPEEHSKTGKERSPSSSPAINGDVAKPASSEPATNGDVAKPASSEPATNGDLAKPASSETPSTVSESRLSSRPSPPSDRGATACRGLPTAVSGPAPEDSTPCHPQLPDAQSPSASAASSCLPATPALPSEGPCHPPSPGIPVEAAPETRGPNSPPQEKVSGHQSPERPPETSPRPLLEGGELLDLARTLPPGEEAAAQGALDPRPSSLAQRRFSEGVLRPPSRDPEKLGGSLAALPQAQGSQSALDRPFGSGTESNWSLSQSFEWSFPTQPSGLGVWRLDSPITEASEAAEAAEAGGWTVSGREQGGSQQGSGAPSAPGSPGRPSSWVREEGPSISPAQKDNGGSQAPSTIDSPPRTSLLQAEERCGDQELLAGQEAPLAVTSREAALPILEPVLGQQLPAPSDQPCILFADACDSGQALPAEEEAVTPAQAETTQPRTEAHVSCRTSPEPVGPDSSSRWLDDLLASPPPSAGSARRGAGSELKETHSPSTCSEGLLGWAQKDLQSEFGIAADPPPSSCTSSGWSQDAPQDYGLGGSRPLGDPGLGESDWASKYQSGAGEGSGREWASRCGLGQEGIDVRSSPDPSDTPALGGLSAYERVVGKPAPPGTQSQEASIQEWERGKRDSQGTYSNQDAELQDQEFEKRDSLGAFSGGDTSLQDWEFGKRDSLGSYIKQDAQEEQAQELGAKDHHGGYSSQDAEKQDREFEKRDSSLGTYGGLAAAQQDRGFGKSAWMRDYSSHGGATAFGAQDRGFGSRGLSSGFSPEEAQQQDEEFEKKMQNGEDSPGDASGATGPEEAESGGLFSPNASQVQDGALGQRNQGSWQDSDSSQHVGGLPERLHAGTQSPSDAGLEEGSVGKRGWDREFSLGIAPQPEAAFSPSRQDWSGDLCLEATEKSYQFGIIGTDRMSGAGLSPSGKMGGGHFVSPEEPMSRAVDWTDQLGLRNLEVSSCVETSSEARENAVGQLGWSDSLSLRDGDVAGRLETGGSEEPRGVGVGEKDWTSDVGMRSRDLAGAGEVGDRSHARESGVGQPDWSGVEAGEFLKSRERGVGQADWTPDLGLRNMAPGGSCSPGEPRELGVGQVDWGDDLGLRNLEVPCDLESGGPRGCGVGRMDWAQDLRLQTTELSGVPCEAREHGVGEVDPGGFRNSGSLSSHLEARDPLEARELGVGETSGPESPGEDSSSPSSETRPEDPGMQKGETPGFGASPRYLARSPPSGSQGLLEEMLATSSNKAAAWRESAASGLRVSLEEEGPLAGADRGASPEPLPARDPLPSWRPQPDGEASRTEEVDGTWGSARARQEEQGPAPTPTPRQPPQGPPPSCPSQDFSFIEDTEVLDSAMYRSRANLGRKRGHRAPAIRPGGTLGLSEAADSDARLFQDSTEPRTSRVPSSDEEVVEEPQSRRTRMSLGLKVNLFPGLSPSALKAKLRSRNRSAEEGEPAENKSSQKESSVQRSKSCKVPGLGKPLTLPPKPEKTSGSEGSSPNWLQALKLKKKKV